MTDIEQELSDLKYISTLKKDIKYLEGRYHIRMAEKEYVLADAIQSILQLCKIDLKRCEDGLIAADSGGPVPSTQYGGNKTVFILKK